MLSPDEMFQTDVAARLSSDAVCSLIGVVREQDGLTESDAQIALGPARAGGTQGQPGSLIVVQQTSDGQDVQPNIPGPREGFRLTVRVLELRKLASQQAGYISFFTVALRVKQLLHLCQLGTSPILYVRGTPYNDGAGTVGKDLLFSWTPAPDITQMVAQPIISTDAEGNVSLASGTNGANVVYTTDGSYPVPTATAFAAPLPPPVPGTFLRAVAYLAGWIPSGVTERLFLAFLAAMLACLPGCASEQPTSKPAKAATTGNRIAAVLRTMEPETISFSMTDPNLISGPLIVEQGREKNASTRYGVIGGMVSLTYRLKKLEIERADVQPVQVVKPAQPASSPIPSHAN